MKCKQCETEKSVYVMSSLCFQCYIKLVKKTKAMTQYGVVIRGNKDVTTNNQGLKNKIKV